MDRKSFIVALAAISIQLSSSVLFPVIASDKALETESNQPTADVTDKLPLEEQRVDLLREHQSDSMRTQKPVYGHWGNLPSKFSNWTNHSNRLIPVYTFGMTLGQLRDEGSAYASRDRLKEIYGLVPDATLHPNARYFDQTDIHRLQKQALDAGCRNIIVMVFDGMDWQTTRAAAIYNQGDVAYNSGRGTGLSILDYRGVKTDFGLVCTSPLLSGIKTEVNSQTILGDVKPSTGGFDPILGGRAPWYELVDRDYLMGQDRERSHSVTDSASSASSICSGEKTYNGSINVRPDGTDMVPLARELQSERGFKIGVVSSVPVSHATPAAAYANNVTRKDYQDISRDLIGLPSSSHRREPLVGVDVLIGGGWGQGKAKDQLQGDNFAAGNGFLHQDDLYRSNIDNGGRYVVAQRQKGVSGSDILQAGADRAVAQGNRLLGFFGVKGGHLPFQTADGDFNPTFDAKGTERYSKADILENPTLADMTSAALKVLESSEEGFWLMVEAGDVDWANHANNLDNSVGAVLSGDAAFRKITEWIESKNAWDETAVIVTADHGHYLVIDDAELIARAGSAAK